MSCPPDISNHQHTFHTICAAFDMPRAITESPVPVHRSNSERTCTYVCASAERGERARESQRGDKQNKTNEIMEPHLRRPVRGELRRPRFLVEGKGLERKHVPNLRAHVSGQLFKAGVPGPPKEEGRMKKKEHGPRDAWGYRRCGEDNHKKKNSALFSATLPRNFHGIPEKNSFT